MIKTKMKIWKKALIGIFLGTIIFTAMPVFGEVVSDDKHDSQYSQYTPFTSYTAYAADPEPAEKKSGAKKASAEAQKFQKTMIEVASSTQQLLNYLLWPVLVMIGGLLDNSILFSNGMEERLREIWINIRNIVNIFFVLIMLGVAIYNVLGIGEEGSNYSIKTMLPRLIIGIIAVNFSFLAIKITLDLVNVLTVSIFAITDEVGAATVGSYFVGAGDKDSNPESTSQEEQRTALFCHSFNGMTPAEFDPKEPDIYEGKVKAKLLMATVDKYIKKAGITLDKEDTTLELKKAKLAKDKTGMNELYLAEEKEVLENRICEGIGLTDHGQSFLDKWGSQNAALALAVNMTDMVFYQGIPVGTENIEKLAINGLFSMLMYMMYATSFIALFVVLLGRLVFMWIAIAMSPVITLFLVVPGIKEQLGEAGKHIDEFVKQAIAPVIIAVVLTIGWIMLSAIKNTNVWNASIPLPETGFPVVGLGTLQDIIVALGTVAIVWLGAKAATGSLITSKVTDSIFGAAEGTMKFLTEKPLRHADWIPITVRGEKKQYSMDEVLTAGRSAENKFSNSTELWDDIADTKTMPNNWLRDKYDKDGTKGDNSKQIAGYMKTHLADNKTFTKQGLDELKHINGLKGGNAALMHAFTQMKMKKPNTKQLAEFFEKGTIDGKDVTQQIRDASYGNDAQGAIKTELASERKPKKTDTPAEVKKPTPAKKDATPEPAADTAPKKVVDGAAAGETKVKDASVVNKSLTQLNTLLIGGKGMDDAGVKAELQKMTAGLDEGAKAGDIRVLLEDNLTEAAKATMATVGTEAEIEAAIEAAMPEG